MSMLVINVTSSEVFSLFVINNYLAFINLTFSYVNSTNLFMISTSAPLPFAPSLIIVSTCRYISAILLQHSRYNLRSMWRRFSRCSPSDYWPICLFCAIAIAFNSPSRYSNCDLRYLYSDWLSLSLAFISSFSLVTTVKEGSRGFY